MVLQSLALGKALIETGDRPAGIERLRKAVQSAQAELAADPAFGMGRNRLASIYTHLGMALLEAETGATRAEGCQVLQRAVDLWAALQSEQRMFGEDKADCEAAAAALARCPARARLLEANRGIDPAASTLDRLRYMSRAWN